MLCQVNYSYACGCPHFGENKLTNQLYRYQVYSPWASVESTRWQSQWEKQTQNFNNEWMESFSSWKMGSCSPLWVQWV